jgi:hypothetical protein
MLKIYIDVKFGDLGHTCEVAEVLTNLRIIARVNIHLVPSDIPIGRDIYSHSPFSFTAVGKL